MRQFKLYNSRGESYDLNSENSRLYSPEGLGFDTANAYERVGLQYLQIEDIIAQKNPTAMIKFDNYDYYSQFARFLQKKPLVLEYKPGSMTYNLDVNVKSVEKSEIGEGSWLHVRITFESLGQWYRHIFKERSDESTGKKYNFQYNYQYVDSAQGQIKHDSLSALRSPCTLIIKGPALNPVWTQRVDGDLVASGKIYYNLPEGRRLVISSLMPYRIHEEDLNGIFISDKYANSDFSTERFMYLREGTNIVTVGHEGVNFLDLTLEAFEYYESV